MALLPDALFSGGAAVISYGPGPKIRLIVSPLPHAESKREVWSSRHLRLLLGHEFQPHQWPAHKADGRAVCCRPPSEERHQSSLDQPHVVEGWQPGEPGTLTIYAPPPRVDLLQVDRRYDILYRGKGGCDSG